MLLGLSYCYQLLNKLTSLVRYISLTHPTRLALPKALRSRRGAKPSRPHYNCIIERGVLPDFDYMDKIIVDSQIHFGKPCLRGTRIPVQSILELLDEGLSFTEIIRDYYPDLKTEDIQACIRYAIALVAAEEIHVLSA